MIDLANKRIYPFFVENPVSGDDIPRWQVPRAFVVERITAIKVGGTGTFDWELRFSAAANDQGAGTLIHSQAGVSNETTGVVYLPVTGPTPPLEFAPVTIPALNWVWLELPAVSTGIARPIAMLVQMHGVERGA